MAIQRPRAVGICLTLVAMIGACSVHAARLIIEDTDNPIICGCTDVDPHSSFLSAKVAYPCWEQEGFGACEQPFMSMAIREIDEGYCQISCGRCDCCKSLGILLEENGLDMFAWALNFTEYGPYTLRPGFMATLLAPTNDAMNTMLAKLGYKDQQAVMDSTDAQNIIADIARYHVLLPIQEIDSLWSAPFMQKNAVMLSAVKTGLRTIGGHTLGGHTITANVFVGKEGTNGGMHILLTGAKSNASILEKDIEACKGWIQVVDTALIPFAMTGYN